MLRASHELLYRAFRDPSVWSLLSPSGSPLSPGCFTLLSSSLLGMHLVHFHLCPFEQITLSTWSVSSSSSLGQFIAKLDLISSEKPSQILSAWVRCSYGRYPILVIKFPESRLSSYVVFSMPVPSTPWKLLKDRNYILLAVELRCLAHDRHLKSFAECCHQMVESGPWMWLGKDI